MTAYTTPGLVALAFLFGGCWGGSGAGAPEAAARRELLRDVPELQAAYEGGGAQAGGSPSARGPSGAPTASRGSVSLSEGFSGTEWLSGTFGGPLSAQSLSRECVGYVAAEPNHEIYHASEVPFLMLAVRADPFDTTLVVQLPDGSFRCNDDTNGLNPAVVLDSLGAGTTRVWVGSYADGARGEYRLAVTTDPDAALMEEGGGEEG